MNVSSASRYLIVLVGCVLSGCASTGLLRISKDELPKAGPDNPVVRIASIWQPASEVVYDNKSYRGFYGQINFIASTDESEPVQVDGTVTIYVFDDHGSSRHRSKPIDKFQFTSAEWNALVHKGKLGATYALFIPYRRIGMNEASCSLVVRYVPNVDPSTNRRAGQVVQSEMAYVDLPGTRRPNAPQDNENVASPAPLAGEVLPSLDNLSRGRIPGENSARPSQPAAEIAPSNLLLGMSDRLSENRPAPVPLTADEEARIIRETRALQKSESFAPVIESGVSMERAPRVKPRAGKHPLAKTREDDVDDDVDDLLHPIGRNGHLIPASETHPLSGL